MFNRMEADMDINAGTIVDGTESIEAVGRQIFDALIKNSVWSGDKV